MKKVAIVGCGISGLSIGRLLGKNFDVTLYEKGKDVGGLIKCEKVKGHLYHKVGGQIFNSRNQEVLNWFWAIFDRDAEFIKAERNARILLGNKQIGYPIENHLFELDPSVGSDIISELISIPSKKVSEYENFEEFLIGNFGKTLYRLYFKPYNQKIWNTDLKHVSLEWLIGKLPMPDLREILTRNIYRQSEQKMVHSTFYYPVRGGSQFVADRLSEGLHIQKDVPVNSIQKDNSTFLLNDVFRADKVVYTGDIRKLKHIFYTENSAILGAMKAVANLKSNGTFTVFCECDPQKLSWLYLPENFTKAHRIIYTGNFSSENNFNTDRNTCVVEFNCKIEREQIPEEIRKLPGNLVPLATNYESDSYVIQDLNTRAVVSHLKHLLEAENFYLLGRFAEWEYYNMDTAMEAAFGLKNKIFQQEQMR